jgi:anti-anti-sigma regulatory factor
MVTTVGSTIIIENDKATLDDKNIFEAHLSTLVSSGVREIHIDLGHTGYIPSELIGLLMWKKKDLSDKGITLQIIKISASLKSLFDEVLITNYFNLSITEIIDY